MNDPNMFGGSGNTPIPGTTPIPIPAPEPIDWKHVAPRWLLLVVILAAFMGIGALSAQLIQEKSERQQRIEAALADTPTRYQSRLSERVAVLETQQMLLTASMDRMTGQLNRQAEATSELTSQLKVLTAELKRGRYR